ncbi:2-oxoglutarate dehydrogenase E1 component [Fonticula alba]|uniref:2-oxoglutarate dehydrogenase, mitochondrial n=1 Tax=Fonticula alba TaxID=691883 RepID=A0A058ZCL9_FONAL|nr:2-oxoglutarate dehydrogenase E1 component [Fonticula alba]KCV71678.1 2-oxoglutarate dehydrogenase E1 component [Fonticula alba]|eukprot:XP_009493256.1 2-oxoglutarate dehydrogenase E1 component [Fonticula alba]
MRLSLKGVSPSSGPAARRAVVATATTSTARRLLAKVAAPEPSENFLAGNAASYIDETYHAWKADPNSVHKSWQIYFSNVEKDVPPGKAFQMPPSNGTPFQVPGGGSIDSKTLRDSLNAQLLVRAFQVRGHEVAKLDPLRMKDTVVPPELKLETYGFTEADLSRPMAIGGSDVSGILGSDTPKTLGEILESLQQTYTGSLGFEYMHIRSREECNWLRERIESGPRKYTKDEKEVILDRLIWSDSFERFVATKYPSEKRFGLEGGESLIPAMKAMIDTAANLGTESMVFGMAHRGRLNMLSNVFRKKPEAIFCEFKGTPDANDSFAGDVKYHLGMNLDRPFAQGKSIHLSMVANPSHLEAVNPVVMGKTRGQQYFSKDETRDKNVSVLIHGDAAFAGQGIVYESLGLTNLKNYTTGGVLHFVINNQIGFTTDPFNSRSTPYCTDVGLALQAPIVHVNGDDVEAVVFAAELAAEYRATFKKDFIIDMICYRRHGHNEIDQPAFTQPLMYQKIKDHTTTLDLYIAQLLKEGSITAEYVEAMKARVWRTLEEAYEQSDSFKPTDEEWTTSKWMGTGPEGMRSLKDVKESIIPPPATGVPEATLNKIGQALCTVPEDFNIHPGIARILDAKRKALESGQDIDMPTAEALAFGALLSEGTHVRISGQDVERGTFSHRHCVLTDQKTQDRHIPLNNLGEDLQREHFTPTNSSLSEYGVLGFELGYSMANPNSLVLWEGQFGDFANTAQVIIDQFIASGETKWHQRSGLTMLMPHGYDGAGPEHSSARIERFLQLHDENPREMPSLENDKIRQIQDTSFQAVYCSTPANYFHALRRQTKRDFRKPQIMFTSKNLLRHPKARSSLAEMSEGSEFQRVISDTGASLTAGPEGVRRVIFCTGQVYYQLDATRELNGEKLGDVAIVRIEQLAPFPFDRVVAEMDKYPNASEIVWAQEEPMNAGCWSHFEPRLRTAMRSSTHHASKLKEQFEPVIYAGRPPCASPATGNPTNHKVEEKNLLTSAFFSPESGVVPQKFNNNQPIF